VTPDHPELRESINKRITVGIIVKDLPAGYPSCDNMMQGRRASIRDLRGIK
jgi:hypothetical protein